MASMLKVADALKHPGQSYPFTADAVIDEMEVLGDPVVFSDIAVHGEYVGSGDTVSLEAVATATVVTRCARCLETVRFPITAEIHAEYSRKPDPEDPDQYCFETSELDLTDAIRDALLLELPLQNLCSENCRGLCPQCGINLNSDSCACRKEERENPFSVLQSIVDYDEEV